MIILFDINHPCHVHIFKNVIKKLEVLGHEVIVTVKEIHSAIYLLQSYQIPYILVKSRADSIIGKIISSVYQNYQMLSIVRKLKVQVGVGSSMNLAHLSRITNMTSVVLDDDNDEVEPLFVKFVHPFADVILSPESLIGYRKSKKALFYPSYHELAYLHPDIFNPDPNVKRKLGVENHEDYFILRFNAFKAHHDINEHGLSLSQKRSLVNMLKKHGKVFISTEREIETEFREYQINIDPIEMHDALYFAKMFLGDSQTMTSEAAMLATPSIRCNTFVRRIAYLDEQEERYGLTFGFKPAQFDDLLLKVNELLSIKDLKSVWRNRRDDMLKEKLNFNEVLINILNGYPESLKKLQKNDY